MWRPPQPGCAGRAASRRCSCVVSASRHHAVVQRRGVPQLPDPYLFASIKGCGSLDQCASLLDAHAGRFTAMLICTLAIQTVQLCSRQPPAQLDLHSSGGGQNRDSSSSSSNSRHRESRLLEDVKRQQYLTRLARLSTRRLGEFRPQQMSSLLWAFARLGYVPPATWLSRFMATVERALVDFPPGRLSQLIWALARLGVTPPTSFLNSFLAESLDKLHSSSPRDLSNTLWALAQMQVVVPPEYLTTAMAAAQPQWAAFQVHELCVFAWGLAKQPASLGAVTKQWVGDLVTHAGVLVPQGSGREAGMLLWALAKWKGVVDPWQLNVVAQSALQVLAREVAAIEEMAAGHASTPQQLRLSSSNSSMRGPQQQQQQQQQEQAAGRGSAEGPPAGSTLQQPAWQPQSLAVAGYYSQLQQAQAARQAAAAAEGTCHAAAVALSSLASLGWRPQVRQEQQQTLLLQVAGRLARHAQQLRHVATLWWSVAALGLRPPPEMLAVLEQQSLRFMQQQQQQLQVLQQQQQQQQQQPVIAVSAATAAGLEGTCSSGRTVAVGDILQLLLACARLKWRPSDTWWQTCYTLLLSGQGSGPATQQMLGRPLLLGARADQLVQLVSCVAAVHGPPPPQQVWQRLFERYEQVTQNISYWRRSGALAAAAAAAAAEGGSASSSVIDTPTPEGVEEEADAEAAISQMSMEEAEFVLAVGLHLQQQEQQQEQELPAARAATAATQPHVQAGGTIPKQLHTAARAMHTSSQLQQVSTGGLPGKIIVWLLWSCAKHEVLPRSRLMVALLQQLLRKLPELGLAPCAALVWALRQLCSLGLQQEVPCMRLLCVVVLGVALRGKRLLRNMLPTSSTYSSGRQSRALPVEAQRLRKQLLALVGVGGLRRPLQQLLQRRKRYVALNRHRMRRGLPALTGAQLQKGLLAW